ncbi:MAG: family 10 glycosylhydrolase [Planctomycetota bacterium]|nr:family 10 glycosylhydrolase [Planctomycetota bacterium]
MTLLASCPSLQSACGDESETSTRLRLSFGGSKQVIWKGRIEFPADSYPRSLRILGMQKDQAGKIFLRKNLLLIELAEPTEFGGVELECDLKPESRISYRFQNLANPEASPSLLTGDFLAQVLKNGSYARSFEGEANRIFFARAPGDDLKFLFQRSSLVFEPGEKIDFGVAIGSFCSADLSADKKISIRMYPTGQPKRLLWNSESPVNQDVRKRFFELNAPMEAGAYELAIDLLEPTRIPFRPSTRVSSRVVQLVVIGDQPTPAAIDTPENLQLIYESLPGQVARYSRGGFKPWEKLNASARKLIFKHIPLASGNRGKKQFEIEPGSIKLFPLFIHRKQLQLKVEIEYLADQPLAADLVLFDRDHPKRAYTELVSATVNQNGNIWPPRKPADARGRMQSMLTWNRSQEPVLMIRNLGSQSTMNITSIRVYEMSNQAREFKLTSNRNRRLFAQFSATAFAGLLAAEKIKETEDYSLDDWRTFSRSGQRLVSLLKSSHFQGAFVDINQDGGSIYPSRILQFTPTLDTGLFAESGRDPLKKDILEVLFRQFSANGLTLVPRMEIPEFVARIESADPKMQKELRLTTLAGEDSSTYNFLHPEVQQLIKQVVLEVVERYAHHGSFGGIALKLGANDQLVLKPGNGFNESLIDQFLLQTPNRPVSSKSAAAKRNEIHQSRLAEFGGWKSSKAVEFLAELDRAIQVTSQRRLLLDFSQSPASPADRSIDFPRLRNKNLPKTLSPNSGFNCEQLSEQGLIHLKGETTEAAWNLADRRREFALRENRNPTPATNPGSLVSRKIVPRRETAMATGQDGFPPLSYQAETANSNFAFRKFLTGQLARRDALLALDGMELGQRALSCESSRVWKTYTQLPNVLFSNVTRNNEDSPIVVRQKSIGDKCYFYIVNQSPWPIQANIDFSTPLVNLRPLNGSFFDKLAKREDGARLEIQLQPFDLVGGLSDQKEFKISDVQFSYPEKLGEYLTRKKDQLLARIRFLPVPDSIANEANGDFEKQGDETLPTGWNAAQREGFQVHSISLPDENGKALSLSHATENQWGWVRSQHLSHGRTGRISVLVSMRVISKKRAPRVRLSIEGESQGTEYYRFGSFSVDSQLPDSARLEEKWKVFAVHFNDVPSDLAKLRVGLDIHGQGEVQVDNVKVFDRWFDNQDREALTKIITTAAHNISAEEYLKAERLLESYWPRFLEEYVSFPVRDSISPSESDGENPQKKQPRN